MNAGQVVEIGRDLLLTSLILALPALAASLLVGLIISVLQTMTSIQEQTLSFVPRLLVVGVVLLLTLPFSLQVAIHFTLRMFARAMEAGR